jgi:hypothetical protein
MIDYVGEGWGIASVQSYLVAQLHAVQRIRWKKAHIFHLKF